MQLPFRSRIHCPFGPQLSPYKDKVFLNQPLFCVSPDRIGVLFHSTGPDTINGAQETILLCRSVFPLGLMDKVANKLI